MPDLGYDETIKVLEELPMTWYPALLEVMVRSAIKKKVFKKDHAHVFVKKIEDRINAES